VKLITPTSKYCNFQVIYLNTSDNMKWGVYIHIYKWSRYRSGVAQRVGRGIALLFHDHGTRRGWVVSSTPQLHFTAGKDPVPILQETGWAPGLVWMGGKSHPHWDSIPNRPASSQWLYRLSYLALTHIYETVKCSNTCCNNAWICVLTFFTTAGSIYC